MKLFILILTILQTCLYAKQRVTPYTEEVEVTRRRQLHRSNGSIPEEWRKIGINRQYGPKRRTYNDAQKDKTATFEVYTTEEINQQTKNMSDRIDALSKKITITAPGRNHGYSFSHNQLPKENAPANLWDFINPIQRNWEYVCYYIQKNEADLLKSRDEAKKANEVLDKKFSNVITELASAIKVEITPLIKEDIKNNVAFREAITNAAMQKLLETILKLEERVKQLESEQ